VSEFDWWQAGDTTPELGVVCTPAQHFAARTPWDRNRTLWGGFSCARRPLDFLCRRFRLGPALRRDQNPAGGARPGAHPGRRLRAALVHGTGAHESAEAVQAHLALGTKRSIGMHFGTFN